MVFFVGNPTNVVICEGFVINNAGFTAHTVLPFLACSLTCFIVLAFQFRHVDYIPRRLDVSGDLDVRAVLRDPVGASVGGALLGTCLIVMIVVLSFFNLEVWMISLPFAVSKFLWDLAWDTWRHGSLKKSALKGKNKQESHATITNEESDFKHQLNVEIANTVVKDQGHNIMLRELKRWKTHHDAMPVTQINSEKSDIMTRKYRDEINKELAVTNGAANRRVDPVPNAVEPIEMLSPTTSTVIFDDSEPLPAEGSCSGTVITPPSQQRSSTLSSLPVLSSISDLLHRFDTYLSTHFPTFHAALPRLPFALVPFAFSQFILIEALSRQGWIDMFAEWLVIVTKRETFKTVWVVGVLGVLLCNGSGTNIGATILLTKIVKTAALTYVPPSSGPKVNIEAFLRSAAIALAVASNIGAVSFTFSASLAGLLWRQILLQKEIIVAQRTFARWNLAPIIVMTAVGLAVVSAEMAVLY